MKKNNDIIVWIDNNDRQQISNVVDIAIKNGFYRENAKNGFINEMIRKNYIESYIRFNIINSNTSGIITYGNKTYYDSVSHLVEINLRYQEIYKLEFILKYGNKEPNYKPRSKK